ncbi:MAG TPA: hypothetical protein VFP72_03920 [Kineosporiaceae bacterium]|nr:hypothetical protein [Kineosporiaceae bacterium]
MSESSAAGAPGLISVLDLGGVATAAAVLGLQRAAYAVEAAVIGHEGIPPLTESLEQLRQAGLTWLGTTVDGHLVAAPIRTQNLPDGLFDVVPWQRPAPARVPEAHGRIAR